MDVALETLQGVTRLARELFALVHQVGVETVQFASEEPTRFGVLAVYCVGLVAGVGYLPRAAEALAGRARRMSDIEGMPGIEGETAEDGKIETPDAGSGGVKNGVTRRESRIKRRSQLGIRPGVRHTGLKIVRLWALPQAEIEPSLTDAALHALTVSKNEGVNLELQVGEYTDVAITGHDVESAVEALRAQFHGKVELSRVPPEEDLFSIPPSRNSGLVEVCRTYEVKAEKGWGTRRADVFSHSFDPVDAGLSQLRNALKVEDGEGAMIQLGLRPAPRGFRKPLEEAETEYNENEGRRRGGGLMWFVLFRIFGEWWRDWVRHQGIGRARRDPRETPESRHMRDRIEADSHYSVKITVLARTRKQNVRRLLEAADKFFSTFRDPGGRGGGAEIRRGGRMSGSVTRAACRMAPLPPSRGEGSPVMTGSEIAAIWHPLGAGVQTYGRRESCVLSLPPPPSLPKKGVRVGLSNYPDMERDVNFTLDVLVNHGRFLGVPGRGKTAAMFRVAESLMKLPGAAHDRMGFQLIDPKQDFFNSVLGAVPAGREDEVIVVDPGSEVPTPQMNLLAGYPWLTPERQASVLLNAFHNRWPANWGPQLAKNMGKSFLALIGANQKRREAGAGPLYSMAHLTEGTFFAPGSGKEAPVRAEVLRWLGNDPRYADVVAHWLYYDEMKPKAQMEYVQSATNKLEELQTPELRKLLGVPNNDVDPMVGMREGQIHLYNLSEAMFGRPAGPILSSMVLNLGLQAGIQRYDRYHRGTDPDPPREFASLVDEVQDSACREMETVINQGRAYRTPLWVAHQELSQIKDDTVRAALNGMNTQAYWKLEGKDAREVARLLGEPFNASLMANLEKFNFVVRSDFGVVTAKTLEIPGTPGERRARSEVVRRSSADRHVTLLEQEPAVEPPPRVEPPNHCEGNSGPPEKDIVGEDFAAVSFEEWADEGRALVDDIEEVEQTEEIDVSELSALFDGPSYEERSVDDERPPESGDGSENEPGHDPDDELGDKGGSR